MRMRVKGRSIYAKSPGSGPGHSSLCFVLCVRRQAVAVRYFLMVISSFARNQSSSS